MTVSTAAKHALATACRLSAADYEAFLGAVLGSAERIEILPEQSVVEQGATLDSMWVVETGFATIVGGLMEPKLTIGTAGPGQLIVTSLQPMTGRSLFTITALGPMVVWRISAGAVQVLRQSWEDAITVMIAAATERGRFLALCLAIRDSILFGKIDISTATALAERARHVVLRGGEALFRQGDPSDALFIVIRGRLNVVQRQPDGEMKVINEIGPGEGVGELGLITELPRSGDVVARRDTTLARLDRADYLSVLRQDPEGIARGLVRTAQGYVIGESRIRSRRGGKLPTYVLVPTRPGLPVRQHAESFKTALGRRGSVAVISSQACIDAGFGDRGVVIDDAHIRNIEFLDWLNDLERDHSCVIYVADDDVTIWTRRCLRQADQIFLLIDAQDAPGLSKVEALIQEDHDLPNLPTMAILLQPDGTVTPRNTPGHLAVRQSSQHFHVRRGERDWNRVARFLTGHAVGVVLGGGGARGFSHIGVLRAMEELEIPIDLIGGTSVGAMISSLYAQGMGYDDILQNLMAMVRDSEQMTLPLVSLMSGARFSRGVRRLLGTTMIEDMWRTFFCISCNLSRAQTRVHLDGEAWSAVLASNSPPGLLPPVIFDRELHVDGALLNGLPLDVMGKISKSGLLVVVDVQPREELFTDAVIEDGLSGWHLLWNRLRHPSKRVAVPGIVEILTRSMAIGGLAQRERVLKRSTDMLLTPPVSGFAVTDHKKGRKIVEVGYDDAFLKVQEWWSRQPKL